MGIRKKSKKTAYRVVEPCAVLVSKARIDLSPPSPEAQEVLARVEARLLRNELKRRRDAA